MSFETGVLAADVCKLFRGECGKGVREDLGPDAESGADPLGNLDAWDAVAVYVAVYGRRSESRYRGEVRLGHAAGLEDRREADAERRCHDGSPFPNGFRCKKRECHSNS